MQFTIFKCLAISLVCNTVTCAAPDLGLSKIKVYNIQRLSVTGIGTFTDYIEVSNMNRHENQQVPKTFVEMYDGKAAISMTSGGLVFLFRKNEVIVPTKDELYCSDGVLPILKSYSEIDTNESDTLLIIHPLVSTWTETPANIVQIFTNKGLDREALEDYLRDMKDSSNFAFIVGEIVSGESKEDVQGVEWISEPSKTIKNSNEPIRHDYARNHHSSNEIVDNVNSYGEDFNRKSVGQKDKDEENNDDKIEKLPEDRLSLTAPQSVNDSVIRSIIVRRPLEANQDNERSHEDSTSCQHD